MFGFGIYIPGSGILWKFLPEQPRTTPVCFVKPLRGGLTLPLSAFNVSGTMAQELLLICHPFPEFADVIAKYM
jgi:hypothetical protein